MVFDTRHKNRSAKQPAWAGKRPDSYHDKETFAEWDVRLGSQFARLHPLVREQWLYRHWDSLNFQHLDPRFLHSELIVLSTSQLLGEVHLEFGGPINVQHDSGAFRRHGGLETVQPDNWKEGTWVLPPVLLCTPAGILDYRGEHINCSHLVIEGSKRYRWLAVCDYEGTVADSHEVFALKQVT